MKNTLFKIISCICIVSLCFNFVLIASFVPTKERYNPYHDWVDNTVTLRIDKQSDIFYMYSVYLKKLHDNTCSADELSGYALAVLEFSNPEIVQGAFDLRLKQNEQIKKLFQEISYAGYLYFSLEKVLTLEDREIIQLQNLYLDLSNLLDRNKTNKSLAYYIFLNDFESDRSIALQNQTKEILLQINILLDRQNN